MAMSFQAPPNPMAESLIKRLFGEPAARDEKTLLFDDMGTVRSDDMKAIANAAGQPATLEIHGLGEIRSLSDGTRYRSTAKGWIRIEKGED